MEYVGSGQADNATTISIPTHQVGDLICIATFRVNATAPSLASGYTNLANWTGSTRSARIGYKIATTNSETSGTWTNAKRIAVVVYRNAAAPTLVATAATNSYPALSGFSTDAWLWRMGGGSDTALSNPSGFTARQEGGSFSQGRLEVFDTNGPYGATSISAETFTGPSGYQVGATFAIEPAA